MYGLSAPARWLSITASSRSRLFDSRLIVGLWLGVQSVTIPAHSQDRLAEPGLASSQTPDSLTVDSQSPDTWAATSENPDSLVVNSRPLPQAVQARPPAALAQTGVSPDALTATSERLSDLPRAAQVELQVDRRINREVQQSRPKMSTPRNLAEAELGLERARARALAANAAVGKMLRRNYPTGEARVRIYDEQNSARAEVMEAQRGVLKWGGSLPSGTTP